ncbi:MAG: DeoR/GlpR transcriptional regulator [Streptomycetaceae bacterium]|nr:DeoR/GlpR transcriptional regulator [Streptomycetaceae bacterium]
MLAGQRRALIMESVRRDGGVRVADLVVRLGVSDMTIRRDLDALAADGALAKVHGGAVALNGPAAEEPWFEAKSGLAAAAKDAIAEAAAALVEPGSVIALSAGSTTYAVAAKLTGVPRLTIVTNSLPIADLLRATGRDRDDDQPSGPTLLLTGGSPTRSAALVGPLADQALSTLHVDLLILGTHGVTGDAGLTTPNLAEAQTNRALIAAARRVAVVADHTKWGVTGLSSFAALDHVDYFVTDDNLPDEARAALGEHGAEVIIAETAGAH